MLGELESIEHEEMETNDREELETNEVEEIAEEEHEGDNEPTAWGLSETQRIQAIILKKLPKKKPYKKKSKKSDNAARMTPGLNSS
uniref:Uncharacterized protein n=1 Tax=Acrobeloides nanus TaxID=290746 RepID=A0A914EDS7_9BILA